VLESVVGPHAINFVNALHLAEQRGVHVHRVGLGPHGDYAEYIELRLAGDSASGIRVAGALLAEGHPRIVRIGDYRVDVFPRGTLVVLRNRDVPGVIGRVGTILGDASVNIAEYHQARLTAGGDALAAVSIDGALDSDVLRALRRVPSPESRPRPSTRWRCPPPGSRGRSSTS
jgi:D-3-phosphoglycerate dehydrogenase / 2-oxoglutarate reductase